MPLQHQAIPTLGMSDPGHGRSWGWGKVFAGWLNIHRPPEKRGIQECRPRYTQSLNQLLDVVRHLLWHLDVDLRPAGTAETFAHHHHAHAGFAPAKPLIPRPLFDEFRKDVLVICRKAGMLHGINRFQITMERLGAACGKGDKRRHPRTGTPDRAR